MQNIIKMLLFISIFSLFHNGIDIRKCNLTFNQNLIDHMSWYIYILRLQSDKYYVGATEDVWLRVNAHFNGKGSIWTRLHKPIAIEMVQESSSRFDEDNWTKRMMLAHGIANVRGGSYTAKVLPPDEEKLLTKQLYTLRNDCFICGRKGHYTNKCPDRSKKSNEPAQNEDCEIVAIKKQYQKYQQRKKQKVGQRKGQKDKEKVMEKIIEKQLQRQKQKGEAKAQESTITGVKRSSKCSDEDQQYQQLIQMLKENNKKQKKQIQQDQKWQFVSVDSD